MSPYGPDFIFIPDLCVYIGSDLTIIKNPPREYDEFGFLTYKDGTKANDLTGEIVYKDGSREFFQDTFALDFSIV